MGFCAVIAWAQNKIFFYSSYILYTQSERKKVFSKDEMKWNEKKKLMKKKMIIRMVFTVSSVEIVEIVENVENVEGGDRKGQRICFGVGGPWSLPHTVWLVKHNGR